MEYFVEIDVEGIFKWGEDISRIENSQCKIEVMGEIGFSLWNVGISG
ncbi:hypothetical protein LJK88_09270 [Paenibacillus sp. P26]|nr:hypothetical protein LJK88_09270 [Paenibacillus sp. P26]UUZ89926.1 hypothetical protein LJK87_28320 [Paenibacillus sp. P25]